MSGRVSQRTAMAHWHLYWYAHLRGTSENRAAMPEKELLKDTSPEERKAAWVEVVPLLNRQEKRALGINSAAQFGYGLLAPTVRTRRQSPKAVK